MALIDSLAELLMKKSTSKSVLILNHPEHQCGVHQQGRKIADCLKDSEVFDFTYLECRGPDDYRDAVAKYDPRAIIYNWYPSTMGWARDNLLRGYPNIKHIGIFHEVPNPKSMEYIVLEDPTATNSTPVFTTVPGRVFKTGRYLFPYEGGHTEPDHPVIGSFGFGFGNKGYLQVVRAVIDDFADDSKVTIRLHMPFATFGDANGQSSRQQAYICAQELVGHSNIQLEVTHDFWDTQKLLRWLASNTINCFFYEHMYGRGISSCIDYALSVERPIAISRSYMFRHIYDAKPSICIEHKNLKKIIAQGLEPLLPYKLRWTRENLRKDYENMLMEILNV